MPTPTARIEQYRKTYQLHLTRLREELGDEDRAVEAAVGGDFNVFGRIEFDLLVSLGLRKEDSVIDVGCGCGRLAYSLRDYTTAKYTGIDVIPELVSYGRRVADRADWDFVVGDGAGIPPGTQPADCICFFSVLTHLSLEDGYRYLRDAARFLKKGGMLVFSFLDFTVQDHWPHFLQSIANQGEDSVFIQYLCRDTVVSWASKLGFKYCAVLDSDRLKIPISRPLEWQNGNVTTGRISIGQSVAVLSNVPNAIPMERLRAIGDFTEPLGFGYYRGLIESNRVAMRDEAERAAAAAAAKADREIQALTRLCLAGGQHFQRLKADMEALHGHLRRVTDELAIEKGRRLDLGESWLPGRYLAPRLPGDDILRYRSFGDNGADIHGPAITYYLYASPYRMFGMGRNVISGWCHSSEGAIDAVRIRLDALEFPGVCNIPSDTVEGVEPHLALESRDDAFMVKFEVAREGRHFLRVEASVAGRGWSTFVSCPIWSLLP